MSNEEDKIQELVEVPIVPENSILAQESVEGLFKSSMQDQIKVSRPKKTEERSVGGMFSSSLGTPASPKPVPSDSNQED